MYKIIIVDDEINAIEGLKILIDKERMNISTMLTSTNALEGLEIIRSERPDLIITDISMPQMTGLEMIAAIKQIENYNPMIVILSGYSTFSYAQTAMSHGVKAYLLKPVDEDELNDKLDELIGEIEASRQVEFEKNVVMEGTFLKILSYDRTPKLLNTFFNHLSIKPNDQILFAQTLIKFKGEKEVDQDTEQIDASFEKMREIFANKFNNTPKIANITTSSQNMISIIFGENLDMAEIKQNFQEVELSLSDSLEMLTTTSFFEHFSSLDTFTQDAITISKTQIEEKTQILIDETFSNKDFKEINELFSKISSNFDTIFAEELQKALTLAFNKAIEINLPLSQFSAIFNAFIINISKYLSGVYEDMSQVIQRTRSLTENAKSIYSIKDDCFDLILKISADMTDHNSKLQNETFHTILTFVNNNFTQSITLKSLAQKFYVNPIYLGRVFKKNTGTLFNEYLTNLRIEKSKVLLNKTNKKVYEIASEIGFSDPNYFIAKFLKFEGITPSQYRKNK